MRAAACVVLHERHGPWKLEMVHWPLRLVAEDDEVWVFYAAGDKTRGGFVVLRRASCVIGARYSVPNVIRAPNMYGNSAAVGNLLQDALHVLARRLYEPEIGSHRLPNGGEVLLALPIADEQRWRLGPQHRRVEPETAFLDHCSPASPRERVNQVPHSALRRPVELTQIFGGRFIGLYPPAAQRKLTRRIDRALHVLIEPVQVELETDAVVDGESPADGILEHLVSKAAH